MSQDGVRKQMSIQLDSYSAQEMIVVTTRSSVYELVVVRGDHGHILAPGGRPFPEFQSAPFLCSTRNDGSVALRTIDIGLGIKFMSGDRSYLTSAVQSICRRTASGGSTECVEASERGDPENSLRCTTILAAAS